MSSSRGQEGNLGPDERQSGALLPHARVDDSVVPRDEVEDTSAPPVSPAVVDLVVDILWADWKRQGERLTVDDVTRQVTKRNLSAAHMESIVDRLRLRGVAIDGLQPIATTKAKIPVAANVHHRASVVRDAIGLFLQNARRYPLLTPDQELVLGRRIRAGQEADAHLWDTGEDSASLSAVVAQGKEARRKMICSNLRLVAHVAREFQEYGAFLELSDLIQEGCLGLAKAVDRFDPDRGNKFSTYAVWWIRQAVTRCMHNDERTVRVPVHILEKISRIRRARYLYSVRNGGRSPTAHQLAADTGMDPGQIDGLLQTERSFSRRSLDSPLDEDGRTLVESLACPRGSNLSALLERGFLTEELEYVIGTLPPREAAVVRAHFGMGEQEPLTLEKIGDRLGVTRERVRQIEKKAIARLAKRARRMGLEAYLVD